MLVYIGGNHVKPSRIVLAIATALYLYAFMEQSAWIFHKLYLVTDIRFFYYLYSLLRATGYYAGQWEYWPLVCTAMGLLVALPWWNYVKSKLRRKAP